MSRDRQRRTPGTSRAAVAALGVLALGLASFSSPGIPRPAHEVRAPAAIGAAPETHSIVSAPPRHSCSESPPAPEQGAAVAAVTDYFHAHRSRMTDAEIRDAADAVVACAAHYGVDANLVMGVIHVESRGDAFALSAVGAMGLMQIMPATGEELAALLGVRWRGAVQLFDPQVNVQMGIAYLQQLRRRFGDWSTALAAYNWGPGTIDRRLRDGAGLPVVYATSVLDAKRNRI